MCFGSAVQLGVKDSGSTVSGMADWCRSVIVDNRFDLEGVGGSEEWQSGACVFETLSDNPSGFIVAYKRCAGGDRAQVARLLSKTLKNLDIWCKF